MAGTEPTSPSNGLDAAASPRSWPPSASTAGATSWPPAPGEKLAALAQAMADLT